MIYLLFAIAGLALLVLGWFLLQRAQHGKEVLPAMQEKVIRLSPTAQLQKLQKMQRFWGVRVESHCRASSQLVGRQYPFGSIPHLPVSGCNSGACECCYVGLPERRHQRDRRAGEDRRRALRMDASERRASFPRREADKNSWEAYGHL